MHPKWLLIGVPSTSEGRSARCLSLASSEAECWCGVSDKVAVGDVVQLEQLRDTPRVWRGRAGREQWCPKPWSPGLLPSWAVETCWWAGGGLGTVCPGHLHQWRVSSGHMGAPGLCPAKASESPGAAGSLPMTLYYPASPPSLRSLGDALSHPTVVDSDSVILMSRCSTRVSPWVCTCCQPLDLQMLELLVGFHLMLQKKSK